MLTGVEDGEETFEVEDEVNSAGGFEMGVEWSWRHGTYLNAHRLEHSAPSTWIEH